MRKIIAILVVMFVTFSLPAFAGEKMSKKEMKAQLGSSYSGKTLVVNLNRVGWFKGSTGRVVVQNNINDDGVSVQDPGVMVMEPFMGKIVKIPNGTNVTVDPKEIQVGGNELMIRFLATINGLDLKADAQIKVPGLLNLSPEEVRKIVERFFISQETATAQVR